MKQNISDILTFEVNILSHFFFPQESNNHRPKILHLSALFFSICVILTSTFILSFAKTQYPYVLGASSSITFEELLDFTNEERSKSGADPLKLNSALSKAASMKALDMLEKDYWSHNSPDGNTPWYFIRAAGYDYVYAGENLARGFSSASDVVSAWMASPSHRENMLSKNFQDVGFAFEEGDLSGEDTIVVVEMLGGKKIIEASGFPSALSTQDTEPVILEKTSFKKPLDSISLTSNFIKIILGIFIATLILDLIVAERKKIIRFAGHNFDHVIFLSMILLSILVLSRGNVL